MEVGASKMQIEYLVIDVDGTMTDGSIYYDESGNELKKFNTRDAAGFFVAKELGIKTIVLTGRECKATERRMKELQVDYLYQNIKDKESFLEKFLCERGISPDKIGYVGDDVNDYGSMIKAAYKACPADAMDEIKMISDYISKYNGGCGAVRDAIRHIVGDKAWNEAITRIY